MNRPSFRPLAIAAIVGMMIAAPVHAVIMVLIPLKNAIEDYQWIFVAKVAEILPEKPGMVLTPSEDLKGKSPFARMAVNLTGNSEAQKGKHTDVLLERIEKETPIVVFANRKGSKYNAFACTEGTWFQLEGKVEKEGDKENVRWSFLSCEPYLRRTYAGTTAELKQIVADAVAKKKAPPEPNEKEQPGFGPALKKEKKCSVPAPVSGGLWAVIQLPFMGAIIGLAALFPTVFGGLALMMKRWMVALTLSGIFSILLTFYFQLPELLFFNALRSPVGFFLLCASLGIVFAFWSARRYRRSLAEGKAEEMQPRKIDRVVLSLFGLGFLTVLAFPLLGKEAIHREPWLHLCVPAFTTLAITFYLFAVFFRVRKLPEPRPPLATSAELVLLWSFVAACGIAAGLTVEPVRQVMVQNGGAADAVAKFRLAEKPTWVFSPAESGSISSSPCTTPDHIVVGVHHASGFSQSGRVYALDPKTGESVWTFDDDGDMKAVFCSPTYADGCIFIGEGFHKDNECKIYCLNAKTGKKLWDFQTQSHTEAKPAVADGHVVFGAGNDGIYCLDARTGKEIWHKEGMHVDAPPSIANGKVFCGSGASQKFPQVNRIFCLNLSDGKEAWGEKVELSAYAPPTVDGDAVFFGTGNSTFSEVRLPKAGQIMARDAATGKRLWDCTLPDTVLGKPAVDRYHVYAGTKDGNLYAIDRHRGEIIWKHSIGGEVLASPFLQLDARRNRGDLLVAVGRTGTFYAFEPLRGNLFWGTDLHVNSEFPFLMTVSNPLVVSGDEGKLHLLIGSEEGRGEIAAKKAKLYCFDLLNGE